MLLTENLKWRYATKKFDPSKKVSPENIERIKEAISLSATSYGLQLYKVCIVSDPVLRRKLLPASWNQRQVTEASHLLILCHYLEANRKHVDDYIKLRASVQKITSEDLKDYGDFVTGKLLEKPDRERKEWNVRQTYIVLGNLLAACAELRIDTCPMEGFDSEAYDRILGLSAMGLRASLVIPIGYRAAGDLTQHLPKVRKPLDELFITW
ncbi:NAD(P)H-dependent oxidoreductase [Sinomicrobium oceani]|uniref:NAD(P)H-dependent oxidoreductase n=1 Tax=Sinomicrobium oceani TaxID=1150368 RepID=UPI00227AE392|nr:NAD(P)H-dependent oxidoreductase [Sinomicrobium oceani]